MTTERKPELWCVNIIGPDDVIAVADYVEAAHVAQTFNTWRVADITKRGFDDLEPNMWAAPVLWPHDAPSHAADLARPSTDYAALIADARKVRDGLRAALARGESAT